MSFKHSQLKSPTSKFNEVADEVIANAINDISLLTGLTTSDCLSLLKAKYDIDNAVDYHTHHRVTPPIIESDESQFIAKLFH